MGQHIYKLLKNTLGDGEMVQQLRVCTCLAVDFLVVTPDNLQLQVTIAPMGPTSFLGTYTPMCTPSYPHTYIHMDKNKSYEKRII